MSVNNNKPKLTFFKPEQESDSRIPYISQGVSAGFPSPALDFMENSIDLNKVLVDNALATFYVRADGHSMMDAGINDKDLLVVDRSLEAENNNIAICLIDGDFTVKRIKIEDGALWLMPENSSYSPIEVTTDNQFVVWGIVTYVVKKL